MAGESEDSDVFDDAGKEADFNAELIQHTIQILEQVGKIHKEALRQIEELLAVYRKLPVVQQNAVPSVERPVDQKQLHKRLQKNCRNVRNRDAILADALSLGLQLDDQGSIPRLCHQVGQQGVSVAVRPTRKSGKTQRKRGHGVPRQDFDQESGDERL